MSERFQCLSQDALRFHDVTLNHIFYQILLLHKTFRKDKTLTVMLVNVLLIMMLCSIAVKIMSLNHLFLNDEEEVFLCFYEKHLKQHNIQTKCFTG